MAPELDPAAIADELRHRLVGSEPPADFVDQLGGWTAIEAIAPALVDEPLLAPTLMLLMRGIEQTIDSGDDVGSLRPAAGALAHAAVTSNDPGLFVTSIEMLCSNGAVVGLVGSQLSAACLTLATPARVDGVETSEAEALRHAVALESAARLAVLEPRSRHDVLAVLTKVTEPQPARYARAVSRTVTVAYDHWNAAEGEDDVADVLDVLTGVTPPSRTAGAMPENAASVAARDRELSLDIAADATWAKANVDIARALRAESGLDLDARLDDALESLTFVISQGQRPDAVLLKSALNLLRGLLSSVSSGTGPQAAETWALALDDVQSVTNHARELILDTHGLNHWSGDRKVTVLSAWARFVANLGDLRDQLDRESIYNAATVLDDILAIYTTTNSYDVIVPGRGVENVVRVIRPAIAKGFAARSGLLRNLIDHTESLRRRIADIREGAEARHGVADELVHLQDRLDAAESVLAAAKASLEATVAGPPGKPLQQALQLPRLLADLLGLEADAYASLADIDQTHLEALNAALADRQAGTDLDPDPILNAVRKEVLSTLSASPDFTDETAIGITQVLDQLIRFIATRQNVQASWRPYLFKPDADEDDLHMDLYDWLMGGHLRSATNVEAQHVGGGRIDLMVTFPGFHLYIELKEDATQIPLASKTGYLRQTIAYQATGVRIGFLVVLRSKAGKAVSPQSHLSELVTHTTIEAAPGAHERHVVMLELPGDRTPPSQM